MEIIINLEIDGEKGDEDAIRESVYAYLYQSKIAWELKDMLGELVHDALIDLGYNVSSFSWSIKVTFTSDHWDE